MARRKKILSERALRKRVKKFELQESEKSTITPACISAIQMLLNDAYFALRPKPSDYEHRGDLVRIFNLLATEVLGNDNGFPIVEAFGSFVMDVFTAESDLDLSVNFSKDAVAFPRDQIVCVLKKFAKRLYALQRRGHVFGVQPIMRARVPILRLMDCGTGIQCDISVENKDGMERSKILVIISKIDERFRKLSFLMKAWAKAYGINSSKDRTLNSLSIISLVALHLQTQTPPILPPFSVLFKDGTDIANLENVVRGFRHFGKENKDSMAELFVSLLVKLSSVETLWPHGLCVSTYEGSWISKTWNSEVGNISVEDFTDRTQNVARSVGKAEVQKIYKSIHISLYHIQSFMKGRIQVPRLKALLFGSDAVLAGGGKVTCNAALNLKRRFRFHDSSQAKRLCYSKATGANKAYAEDPWLAALLSASCCPPSNFMQLGSGSNPEGALQVASTRFESSNGLDPSTQISNNGTLCITKRFNHYTGNWPVWPQKKPQHPPVEEELHGLNQIQKSDPPLQFDRSHGLHAAFLTAFQQPNACSHLLQQKKQGRGQNGCKKRNIQKDLKEII